MQVKNRVAIIEAYAFYYLTGAVCLMAGSALPHLAATYKLPIGRVVFIGSAYALGRLLTVNYTGKQVEKVGPTKVLAVGLITIIAYILALLFFNSFYIALVGAFIGGIGMGAQDAICPYIINISFSKERYASALSLGQVLFALGCFTTPFTIGLALYFGLPFRYGYYVILIIAIIMLLGIPFMNLHNGESKEKNITSEESQQVSGKRMQITLMILLVCCFLYSSAVNTITLYTTSFATSVGISDATAQFLLTTYNVGSLLGSLVFTFILTKVKAYIVLASNSIMALFVFVGMLLINVNQVYFIGLFISGFLLGVLFSVIITLATSATSIHVSIASSYVATSSAISDTITPAATGFLVENISIGVSYIYVSIMLALVSASAIFVRNNISKEGGNIIDSK